MDTDQLLAAVELGGTKSIALLARGHDILEQITVPTTTPDETLSQLQNQLRTWYAAEPFSAIGIASFGPVQLQQDQPDFGCMLDTPKPNWSQARVAPVLTEPFSCPWKFDTDVNGAALAEYKWGAGKDCDSVCYVTIGTGLGAGLLIHGTPIHGAMHPEVGHIKTRRAEGDSFGGACPFHGDCIEGLVAGPALAARFNADMRTVPDDHPVWQNVAHDIAELTATILLTTSAQRILYGGGVSTLRPFLLPMVRERVVKNLGSYLPFLDAQSAKETIRSPALGNEAGPRGALALAMAALES